MGSTKRICELILQGLAKNPKIKLSIVRFGNVLGSSGSVVPIFKNQIKKEDLLLFHIKMLRGIL